MQEKFDYFNVNNRIMQIMRVKGYNKNSLSKLIGISQPALKKIEDNENLPSFKLLFELKQAFPDINPDWLLTGEGNMLKPSSQENKDTAPLTDSGESSNRVQQLEEALKIKDQELQELRQQLKDKEQLLGGMLEIIKNLTEK